MIRLTLSAIIATLTLTASELPTRTEKPYLLSDNTTAHDNPAFSSGAGALPTGAGYQWVEEGEFATDPESLRTGKMPNGTNRALFNGSTAGGAGNQTWSTWQGGKWATIRIDLQEDYLIDSFSIWVLNDQSRRTESAEILLSSDGKNFTSQSLAVNKNTILDPKVFVRLNGKLTKPVLARFVELRIKRDAVARQQQISELAVWGWPAPVKQSKLAKANDRPAVQFELAPIQDGAAMLVWKDFAAWNKDAKKWRIYKSEQAFERIDDAGVSLVTQVDGKMTSCPLYPFKPGSNWYFAVTAVYEGGEAPTVQAKKCRFMTPFECNNFGDMLAFNHYWSGEGVSAGGYNVRKSDPTPWNEVALDLLEKTGVKVIRWWGIDPVITEKYLRHGIGVMTFPRGEKKFAMANALGMYSFSMGNEPDLNLKITPAQYVADLKHEYILAKKASPLNVMAAPTSCLVDTSLKWLEKFYQAGGKDYFDILDLHTYSTDNQLHGRPEILLENMRKVKAITDQYGDSGKPLISSEFGYPDCMGSRTPLEKAQFLVRGLILHYALGFKRVFIYSLWDEGEDPLWVEHHFGLLDYDLQKKPAYFAFMTMSKELGKCVLVGPLPGCGESSLGYLFKDQSRSDYVTVIWDPAGENIGVFQTAPGRITVTDLSGDSRELLTEKDGSFSVPYGLSPVYIRTSRPVTMQSAGRTAQTIGEKGQKLSASVDRKIMIINPQTNSLDIPVRLQNPSGHAVDCRIQIQDAAQKEIGVRQIKLPPASDQVVPVKVDVSHSFQPEDAAIPVEISISFKSNGTSYSNFIPIDIRRLLAVSKDSICTIKHVGARRTPLWILANPSMEISFYPQHGGRLIDLIDRRTLTQQVFIDYSYSALEDLKRKPYHYFWFDMKDHYYIPGRGGLDGTALSASSPDGKTLLLRCTKRPDLDVAMKWSMGEDLRLDLSIVNKTDQPAAGKFYLHPEYALNGQGSHFNDIIVFPTANGPIRTPFWAGLLERPVPDLNALWWTIQNTGKGISLTQKWSDGWLNPRMWFGNNSYNLEMTKEFNLPPKQSWHGWLTWQIKHEIPPK